jgi:hypothetical protein
MVTTVRTASVLFPLFVQQLYQLRPTQVSLLFAHNLRHFFPDVLLKAHPLRYFTHLVFQRRNHAVQITTQRLLFGVRQRRKQAVFIRPILLLSPTLIGQLNHHQTTVILVWPTSNKSAFLQLPQQLVQRRGANAQQIGQIPRGNLWLQFQQRQNPSLPSRRVCGHTRRPMGPQLAYLQQSLQIGQLFVQIYSNVIHNSSILSGK